MENVFDIVSSLCWCVSFDVKGGEEEIKREMRKKGNFSSSTSENSNRHLFFIDDVVQVYRSLMKERLKGQCFRLSTHFGTFTSTFSLFLQGYND